MRPDDVTAYGCDYSAREFTPDEINRYPGVWISWLARYIGYPGNRKCISAYPGAYQRHTNSGRPVVLFHQVAYRDFEGGYASGRAHAQIALADARSKAVGWDGETPILAVFDRRMPEKRENGALIYRAIPLNEVRDYMRGFVSVLGYETAGFYGFEDTMRPCVDEDWVRFRMQCGARSAHIPGISSWQENNEQPLLLGTQTDRLELYVPLDQLKGGDDVGVVEGFTDKAFVELLFHRKVSTPDPEGAPDWQLSMAQLLEGSWRGGQVVEAVVVPLLAKLANDPDVDAETMNRIAQDAARTAGQEQGRVIAEALGAQITDLVTSALEKVRDSDNLDEAKKTVAELLKQLRAALSAGEPGKA
jgi:hypothetical protein